VARWEYPDYSEYDGGPPSGSTRSTQSTQAKCPQYPPWARHEGGACRRQGRGYARLVPPEGTGPVGVTGVLRVRRRAPTGSTRMLRTARAAGRNWPGGSNRSTQSTTAGPHWQYSHATHGSCRRTEVGRTVAA
jgi:hypothetical protein